MLLSGHRLVTRARRIGSSFGRRWTGNCWWWITTAWWHASWHWSVGVRCVANSWRQVRLIRWHLHCHRIGARLRSCVDDTAFLVVSNGGYSVCWSVVATLVTASLASQVDNDRDKRSEQRQHYRNCEAQNKNASIAQLLQKTRVKSLMKVF